jgi:L-ascorbate metabolism protein UlaG (beta-lactamase superfamily)
MNKKKFNVRNGKFYSLLETKDYGEIVFGCPPGIVKDFLRIKKPLPAIYIIPSKTFCDNLNNFDFEFIVYTFLFSKSPGSNISVYCLSEQEKRFRTILNETLFGPKFRQLLESQSHKLLNENFLDEENKKNLHKLLAKDFAKNKNISFLFDNLLREHRSKLIISKEIEKFIEDEILYKNPLILDGGIKNISKKLTKIYIQCAQLQKELDLFSLAKEKDRNSFISRLIKFHHLNKSNFCILSGVSDKTRKLKIQEVEVGVFKIFEKKVERCIVNLNSTHTKTKIKRSIPIKVPFFGVTFIGVGSGFSHDKENSSLIVWSENKGIMIDVVADNNSVLLNYGINKKNVNHVFLTHVHSDHDAGVLENLLEKRKTYLITSRIIYESFLRKTQALTSLSRNSIERFVEFVEVEPNKKIKIPEFDNTFFEFDYSLHSIPSGRCKITYAKGKTHKTISHSGDTKYDVPKVNAWYEKGAFTQQRKNKILSFIWDADLIIHDVGGGILHTNYESLLNLEKNIKHKTVLVHQNDKPPLKNQLRYVVDGESIALIK